MTAGTGTSVPSPPNTTVTSTYDILTGGTQTSGGTNTCYQPNGTLLARLTGSDGKFGYAMAIPPSNPDAITDQHHTQSSGGGGWWGGAGGHHGGGGGGSSFISGHLGCVKIAETPLTCVPNSSELIDGEGYVWTTTRSASATKLSTITSNPGGNNGYAKITSQ